LPPPVGNVSVCNWSVASHVGAGAGVCPCAEVSAEESSGSPGSCAVFGLFVLFGSVPEEDSP